MEIRYYQRVSNEATIADLSRVLSRPCYEIWNDTSIVYITSFITGVQGEEARQLAIKLIKGYIAWWEFVKRSTGLKASYLQKFAIGQYYRCNKIFNINRKL